MQLWEPADIEDVGGLDALKAFISNRAKAYRCAEFTSQTQREFCWLVFPAPGSLCPARQLHRLLNWPLIRLDIGALKGSLVGESERRMRDATQIINAFGNAVIWIDELEKAFAGTRSSGETDGGTTSAIFGYFLTWLQETTAPILVMATANNISQLPPEFIRSGRFDAIFFVDLPQLKERQQIIEIVNRKWSAAIPAEFAERLNGYTGAEIEQIAKDSLFDGVEPAITSLIPLSRVMKEDINALKDWARNRARTANTPEDIPEQRKIRRKDMSHLAKIELEIKDLAALRAAVQNLGYEFRENQQTYAWYGSWVGDSPLPDGVSQRRTGQMQPCHKGSRMQL